MKRHPIQNPIIHQLTYENHMLRTQYQEIHHKFMELQHEFEKLKHKCKDTENHTNVLRILQNKNTELNRELSKKNKQISMLLNNPTNGSSLLSDISVED
jgi:predicted RNase H-like nuclease (RuvC/YqgF family)